MDMHLLKTFVAAFEEASFTKAARRLNATQPGVSVQIASLEASVGKLLFDRNARSVTPTVAGRHLYPRAIKLIRDVISAEQEIRSLSGVAPGRLAVGIPPALGKAILAPALSRYLETHLDVNVRVVEAQSDSLLSLVETQELDFALVTEHVERPTLSARKIYSDRLVLASGSRGALEADRAIHLDDMSNLKMVLPSFVRRGLHEDLKDLGIVAARVVEMDGLVGALEFVARTDWVALVPASIAHAVVDTSAVRFNTIAGKVMTTEYSVVHARTEPLAVAAQAFIDLAMAEFNRIAMRWPLREPSKLDAVKAELDAMPLQWRPRVPARPHRPLSSRRA